MTIEFQNFNRKKFSVSAVRVTPLNIEAVAEACGGKIHHDGQKEGNFSRDYIKVRVQYPMNERQTEAHIGDWVVKQGGKFKVYQDRAFRNNFETQDGTPIPKDEPKAEEPHHPSPSDMPKKRTEVVAEAGPELVEIPEPSNTIAVEKPETLPDMSQGPFPKNSAGDESEKKTVVTEETLGEAVMDDGNGAEIANSPGPDHQPEREQLGDDELREMGFPTSIDDGYEPIYRDELEPANLSASTEEKQSISLDELNSRPGDPRSAQEIMNERS